MSLAFPPRLKKQWLSLCSHTKRGISDRATFPQQPEQRDPRSWERSRMRRAHFRIAGWLLFFGASFFPLLSCSKAPDPNTLVMIIESSPTNLDPRVGIDAQSERIDELLFDALLIRDEHLN